MKKERQTIEYKDTTDKELSKLPEDFDGNVIVKGNVKISNNFCFPCSLFVTGMLECKRLEVMGELYVEGSIEFKKIHIRQEFFFKGNGSGKEIIVDGDCSFEGKVKFDSLKVSGRLDFKENWKEGKQMVISGKDVTITRD